MSFSSTRLRGRGLCFAHGHHEVLHGVDVDVAPGAVTVVCGPNGAGKSTLVELLAGVRTPRAGRVERDGSLALVVQRPTVPDALPVTVRDVVAMGTWSRSTRTTRGRRSAHRAADDVRRTIDLVGLADLADRPLAALSGGQRQRALLGQGLVQDVDTLLLDEPAAGLDADSRATVRRLLAETARERGTAVLCVSHDEQSIAAADHVVRIVDGRVRAPRPL
ncbi:ATP-binding cassette domain-containing protein [Nocardioidaceae bacterium]|nr:ATP-binding cassette domain-containing protein [Nocardioidaceae bacterium]